MSKDHLSPLSEKELQDFTSLRTGETKVGEILLKTSSDWTSEDSQRFSKSSQNGIKYGIILVPEDIGPRGNLGRPGAALAPEAFLSFFCNMQANQFYDYTKVMIAGQIETGDLNDEAREASPEKLRLLCESLDGRVQAAVEELINAGIKPIVIGGGNNNSLPTIRGATRKLDSRINCINCDPHADYRRLEGRHSGNPFSYAHEENLLNKYCVFSLHENYNSQDMLDRLKADGFRYLSYEDCFVRKKRSYEEQLKEAAEYLKGDPYPLGVELDLDSIKNMPSSALTPFGISEEEAVRFIHYFTDSFKTAYLHLSEGAPSCTTDDGIRKVGKFMALAVITFLKADKI